MATSSLLCRFSRATGRRDREDPADWRVEYQDDDGSCFVTIFSGPQAQARARAYYAALETGKIKLIA